jgi:hypothetical protein
VNEQRVVLDAREFRDVLGGVPSELVAGADDEALEVVAQAGAAGEGGEHAGRATVAAGNFGGPRDAGHDLNGAAHGGVAIAGRTAVAIAIAMAGMAPVAVHAAIAAGAFAARRGGLGARHVCGGCGLARRLHLEQLGHHAEAHLEWRSEHLMRCLLNGSGEVFSDPLADEVVGDGDLQAVLTEV